MVTIFTSPQREGITFVEIITVARQVFPAVFQMPSPRILTGINDEDVLSKIVGHLAGEESKEMVRSLKEKFPLPPPSLREFSREEGTICYYFFTFNLEISIRFSAKSAVKWEVTVGLPENVKLSHSQLAALSAAKWVATEECVEISG